MYDLVAPTLLDLSGLSVGLSPSGGAQPQKAAGGTGTGTGGGGGGGSSGKGGKEDPIMQARAVACLAAAWPRVPSSPSLASSSAAPGAGAAADESSSGASAATVEARDTICNLQRANAAPLTRALSGALSSVVWSVRVPIYRALSAVVSRTTTTSGSQTPVLTGSLLADVVQAVELGAEDAKYSQVCMCVCICVCWRPFCSAIFVGLGTYHHGGFHCALLVQRALRRPPPHNERFA